MVRFVMRIGGLEPIPSLAVDGLRVVAGTEDLKEGKKKNCSDRKTED
jgi:hypothetical protein